MSIPLNKVVTVTKFTEVVVDANGKRITPTRQTEQATVRWQKNNNIQDEEIASIVTSINDVYNLYSDCDLNIAAKDIVAVDGNSYVVRRVTRQQWDSFFVLRAVCEKA